MRILTFFVLALWLGKCNIIAQTKPESFTAQAGTVAHYTQDTELGKLYTGLHQTDFSMHFDARESRVTINEGGRTLQLEGVHCQYLYQGNSQSWKKVWKLAHQDYGTITLQRTPFGDVLSAKPTYGGDAELNYFTSN